MYLFAIWPTNENELNGPNNLRGSQVVCTALYIIIQWTGMGTAWESGQNRNTFCENHSHYNLWCNKFERLFVKLYAIICRCAARKHCDKEMRFTEKSRVAEIKCRRGKCHKNTAYHNHNPSVGPSSELLCIVHTHYTPCNSRRKTEYSYVKWH